MAWYNELISGVKNVVSDVGKGAGNLFSGQGINNVIAGAGKQGIMGAVLGAVDTFDGTYSYTGAGGAPMDVNAPGGAGGSGGFNDLYAGAIDLAGMFGGTGQANLGPSGNTGNNNPMGSAASPPPPKSASTDKKKRSTWQWMLGYEKDSEGYLIPRKDDPSKYEQGKWYTAPLFFMVLGVAVFVVVLVIAMSGGRRRVRRRARSIRRAGASRYGKR